jgi:DNA-binding protein HU-beta
MNKTDLAHELITAANLTKRDAVAAVEALFGEDGVLFAAFNKGTKVSIHGFGTFLVKKRAARMAHNPQTNAKVAVPATQVVRFSPGKNLKDAVAAGFRP